MVGTSAKMKTPSAKGSAIRPKEHPHEDAYADGLHLVRRVQRLAGEEAARQRAEGPGDEVDHRDDEADEGDSYANERRSYHAVLLMLMLTPYSLGFPRLGNAECGRPLFAGPQLCEGVEQAFDAAAVEGDGDLVVVLDCFAAHDNALAEGGVGDAVARVEGRRADGGVAAFAAYRAAKHARESAAARPRGGAGLLLPALALALRRRDELAGDVSQGSARVCRGGSCP